MRAHHIMKAKVVTVTPDTSIVDAANIMLRQRISGLPVVDKDGTLVGILSEGDFLRRGEIRTRTKRARWLSLLVGPSKSAEEFVRECGKKVSEVMSSAPLTIAEDTPLEDIVQIMEKNNVKRLPVLRVGKIVGIVTRSDLLQAVAILARDVPDPTADDEHIRNRIIRNIESSEWRPLSFKVIVHQGIVDITGVITDERQRQAILVTAENVTGVKKVHDHICWVEPMSGAFMESPEDDEIARVGRAPMRS